jgi:putative ABC transport system ATP-binding protein
MQEVIRLDNVGKIYGSKGLAYTSLRNISIKIHKNEFVTILGPSGSGKTTLMNLIGTLDRPTSGKVFIDGQDTSMMNEKELSILRNKKIGFVFQSYNLVPYLSVRENIRLPCLVDVDGKEAEKIEKTLQILEDFGVPKDHFGMLPNMLSGGQQQRVSIARALVNNPAILLADEPTGNLDSASSDSVMRLLSKLREEFGTTIVLVTHEQEIAAYSQRSIFLRDGILEKDIKLNKKGK